MKETLLDLLISLQHEANETRRITSNSIINFEHKQEVIECYNEGYITDIDHDLDMLFDESAKDYSKYDFKTHDPSIGEANHHIAKILCEIISLSNRIHHRNEKVDYEKTEGDKSLYDSNVLGSNYGKYQKTLDLFTDPAITKQNFLKAYIVTDKIGRYPYNPREPESGRKAFVFFVEIVLPQGTFLSSWHLMKDGTEKYQQIKNTVKNSILKKLEVNVNGDGKTIIRYGGKRITEYTALEKRFADTGSSNTFIKQKIKTAFDL